MTASRRGIRAATILTATLAAGASFAGRPGNHPAASFESSVSPILRRRCVSCHGADHPRTGLDVRTLGNLLEGGHSGPAIVPGSPEKSLLFRLVSKGAMPPGGPKLTASELKRIETWIRAGAPGKSTGGHWAFRPPVRPVIPSIRNPKSEIRNPIDSFLVAALQRKCLSFSREADRRTLIRRVTYDLIGLPPTPAEVDAFLADRSPNAYEKVVDRLLADPRFGERWARHWLDPAGYADSEGILQEDLVRPNAYRYRDYVIRSFNEDKPYDQFLREQIAGDELYDYRSAARFTPKIEGALTATGFLRTAVDATRTDFNPHQFQEYQLRMLNDMETILATTVMGLPIQCARCHDHKYEPLSQKDYYRIQACFAGAVRPDGPLLPSRLRQVVCAGLEEQRTAKEQNARVDAVVKQINDQIQANVMEYQVRWVHEHAGPLTDAGRQQLLDALRTDPAKRTPTQKKRIEGEKALAQATVEALQKTYPEFKARDLELVEQRNAEEKKRTVLPEIRALYDQDARPPDTHLLVRGEWSRKGDIVPPGIPAILDRPGCRFALPAPPADAKTTGRRKALAEWLSRPDNPLTARVIVNRLWAHHFGVGIVPTVDNLGRSGAPPSNQALLDWLAMELVEPGRWVVGSSGRWELVSASAHRWEGSRQAMSGTNDPTTQRPNDPKPWSLKAIHRLIVTSAAYRQGSRNRPEAARIDPDDTLLWRQRPRRLEAEPIRDAMLAVAGNLDPTMYGEPVRTETHTGGDIVPLGEDRGGRRSIYLLVRRSEPVTVLNTFDAPVMETNCTRRTVATTATQALALMNSSFITAQAKQFARRLTKEAATDEARIALAFRLAYSRPPRADELASAEKFVQEQIARYGKMDMYEASKNEAALADFCQALLSSNEFLYVD